MDQWIWRGVVDRGGRGSLGTGVLKGGALSGNSIVHQTKQDPSQGSVSELHGRLRAQLTAESGWKGLSQG